MNRKPRPLKTFIPLIMFRKYLLYDLEVRLRKLSGSAMHLGKNADFVSTSSDWIKVPNAWDKTLHARKKNDSPKHKGNVGRRWQSEKCC